MSNRVVETLYRLRDQSSEVLRRITGGYRRNAEAAESTSARVEAANRRQRSSLSGILAKIGRLRFAYFAVAGAVFGAVRAVGRFTRAASEQENAEARLATAIQNGAGATEEQIDALKELAAERQRVTRFGDEQTISAQAQLATFRLNADQISKLTPRVQDLAEGTRRLGQENVDLEQSAQLVGRAITGNIGSLTRYGVVLTDAQREAIRFGDQNERIEALVEALDGNFRGLAESLTPFEQATRTTENAVGDFGEKVGSLITQSPSVAKAIDSIGASFERLGDRIGENTSGFDRFIGGVVGSFRVLASTASITFDTIILGANRLNRKVLESARGVAETLSRVTFGAAGEALDSFIEKADNRIAELEESSDRRFMKIGESAGRFLEAGEDLNKVLFDNAQAQRDLNTAVSEGEEESRAQQQREAERREALERTRETLEKLGIDAGRVETGISEAARQSTAELVRLAEDGEASLEVLSAAATQTVDSFSTEEIEFFRDRLNRAARDGQVNADQFGAIEAALDGLSNEADDTGGAFDRMREQIAEALDAESFAGLGEARVELGKLRAAGELTADEFDALSGKIQGAVDDLNQFEPDKGLEPTTDEARRAGEEMQELSSNTDDARESAAGAGAAIAAILGTWRDLSESANEAVEEFLSKVTGGTVEGFFSRLASFNDQLAEAQQRQIEQADRIEAQYQRTGNAVQFAADAQNLLNSRIQLLDNSRVEALQQAMRAARDEVDRMRESTSGLVESIEDDLLRLEGKTEELDRRRLERRREEIKLKLQQQGIDRESRSNLQRALELLDRKAEIRREQAAKARQEAEEREKSADATEREADAADKASKARQSAAQAPPRELVVKFQAEGGAAGEGQLAQTDLQQLAREAAPLIIDEIRRDQQRGL